ncbi:double-cubane-cluster-containing anaerobic reductase [Lactonifactor longoviformis]|uniref:Benzoyl-CoA reductase/2-hydroxyglutaryl-CoA dehydratase subunit, BcrC/BadD/HgdB n=3 Tax=Lactonifactor TaxID=420345 RepID=A0A1M4VHV3_9CLOT|nr:double-cubane-cluster-containing anaerobic reductase [Lactonifactor longoviformis]SHE68477.1 Benzoyl-CoA reductase/2-hydroxyglutaryl-CoA dehydratase subunit, BcrC/BadD/HgdB [Lactonifactor longoviformis DSM 17459]
MELIKELPEVFEDFAEQRKNSFLAVKELKDQGVPVVGVFCTYLPQEIPAAMGAAVVGLCSTSDETIPEAEKELPRNLCPLIKSSYGFAKTDKCPFFYFSDLIVGETTCDGKKKMYEQLGEFKPVHVMELPNSQSEDGLQMYKNEIIRFQKVLEEKFGITITEEDIRRATHLRNEERKALKAFYELMKLDPAPMKGQDLFQILYGSTFKFDKEKVVSEINAIREKVESEYKEGKCLDKRPRILVTGSPVAGGAMKVVKAIEDNGGVVVAFENCGGARSIEALVDEDAPDIYQALASRYLSLGCSCMSPNPNRYRLMGELIEDYKADAVVDVVLQACHTYNVETMGIKKYVKEQYGIPYMSLETDYSTGDIGQLNTRMAAFIEML